MRNKAFLFVAATLISMGAHAAQTPETREHGADALAARLSIDSLRELDAAMQKHVDDGKVSGAIGLISRNGKTGYYQTFGHRVIETKAPMQKDTLFRIYSMTKPIVAVTAMSLWEEGKFKLDDPISNHLPEWKNATVNADGGAIPAKTPVTARHLMTHSSGITYGKNGLRLGDASLEEFSRSLAARPLKFQPGTQYQYGYSIDILGRYIEAIEGKTLDVVMRERVFDKLGMDDTEFWVRDAADKDRVAIVYTRNKQGRLKPAMGPDAVMTKPARMMGGQGLMSTTGDYARFCHMLLNKGELDGQRLLKRRTVDLMFQNHLKKIGKVYGLGGTVNGKGLYAWGGAAGTGFWVNHANDSCAVFMIQRSGYKVNTYGVFKDIAAKALGSGKNSDKGAGGAQGRALPKRN